MSFSDWIFGTDSPGTMFAALNEDAIVGNHSLRLFTNQTGLFQITGYLVSSPFINGIDHGIIYTLMRIRDNTNFSFYSGLFCMADDDNPEDTGALYVLQVAKGTSNNVQIRKATSGGIDGTGASGTQIGSSGSVNFDTNDDTVCIALEWDSTSSLGTELTGYVGTAIDFSDLAQFTTAIDMSSPLVTTLHEGVFLHQDSSSLGPCDILFDSTRILNL